jgi:hypothetical protein
MFECDYCGKEFAVEDRLRTHLLVKHPDEIDSDEGKIEVSEGHLKEKEVEKGEQFGYR